MWRHICHHNIQSLSRDCLITFCSHTLTLSAQGPISTSEFDVHLLLLLKSVPALKKWIYYGRTPIVTQVKRNKLTKTFMIISNWKKNLWSQWFTQNPFSIIRVDVWTSLYMYFGAPSRQGPSRHMTITFIDSLPLSGPQYHRQHYILHWFEQFRAIHSHNHDNKPQTGTEIEFGTAR